MEKIDLSMKVPHFCISYVSPSVAARVANVLNRVGFETVKDVCQMEESELYKCRDWGRKSQKSLENALAECGLHQGMTDGELADYEKYWLEERAKATHADTINWEQRRWELATSLFAHYPDLTNVSALELADNFIANYKEPYKTSTLI